MCEAAILIMVLEREAVFPYMCVYVYILRIVYTPECLPVIKQLRCCAVYSQFLSVSYAPF